MYMQEYDDKIAETKEVLKNQLIDWFAKYFQQGKNLEAHFSRGTTYKIVSESEVSYTETYDWNNEIRTFDSMEIEELLLMYNLYNN